MTCPICAKDTAPNYKPFCSRRCANIDLGRWLNESYVVPAPPGAEDDAVPTDETSARPQ